MKYNIEVPNFNPMIKCYEIGYGRHQSVMGFLKLQVEAACALFKGAALTELNDNLFSRYSEYEATPLATVTTSSQNFLLILESLDTFRQLISAISNDLFPQLQALPKPETLRASERVCFQLKDKASGLAFYINLYLVFEDNAWLRRSATVTVDEYTMHQLLKVAWDRWSC